MNRCHQLNINLACKYTVPLITMLKYLSQSVKILGIAAIYLGFGTGKAVGLPESFDFILVCSHLFPNRSYRSAYWQVFLALTITIELLYCIVRLF